MALYRFSRPWDATPAFDELRRGMDELFERVGTRPAARSSAYPPVNLYEAADAYVVTAELPGVRSDEIEISIEGNRVALRGERRIERPSEGSLHRVERQSGTFRRAIELPAEVDVEKAEATHRNGVLVLRIPKAEKHQPRRVRIQSS